MSSAPQATESNNRRHRPPRRSDTENGTNGATVDGDEDEDPEAADEDEDDDEEEEEEEPKLKYASLTSNINNVYRNGDSTAAFAVAGDKMIVGTHNGSIHALAVPSLQTLRTYRAHTASVTSISISPTPPAPLLIKSEGGTAVLPTAGPSSKIAPTPQQQSPSRASLKAQKKTQQGGVPASPNNQIYIATSSLDGHVCISSLVNAEDVQLRNFARPVNAVALSPDYKNDRTYLSGGLAGNLILTVGGKAGVSTDANTNSAAAAASGWLGSLGLSSNTGRDSILHSGEGAISNIKWSLTGKWVVWVNEEGIKIMRSRLKLGAEESEDAWHRIAHAPRPMRWEGMAGVWKARCEWVDDRFLEADDLKRPENDETNLDGPRTVRDKTGSGKSGVEKLVVGWGDTAWVMHVRAVPPNKSSNRRPVGTADIIHKLQFRDCVVSGISFFTPSLLAILAYRTRDDDDKPIQAANPPKAAGENSKSDRKGRQHRHTSLAPQLRLVMAATGEEVDLDELSGISRFQTLSAQDYHLGQVYIPAPLPEKATKELQSRGALESLWEVTGGNYAARLLSSGASIRSSGSGEKHTNGRTWSYASPQLAAGSDVTPSPDMKKKVIDAHPYALESGLKLFIHSPYDCILSVRRDLADQLLWFLRQEQYNKAWQLINNHPEAVDVSISDLRSVGSGQESPTRSSIAAANRGLADFFADEASSAASAANGHNSTAQKEKQRIGELWLQQLVASQQWSEAGKVAGKVLGTSNRWEHWVQTFAQAKKFDDITPFIPSTTTGSPLPSHVYEVILGHYIHHDLPRLNDLLDSWDPELFNVDSVISAIESRLASGDISKKSVQDSVTGRDWRIAADVLARLYLANGRAAEALRCYIQLQDAEKTFSLIREERLLDTARENVVGLIMLRVSTEQLQSASLSELEDATSEAITLLVDESLNGTLPVEDVIDQLTQKDNAYQILLFLYLRALWNSGISHKNFHTRRRIYADNPSEGHSLVAEHADLAIRLFAEYDHHLLTPLLQFAPTYDYEAATQICRRREYYPELVQILTKTGETRAALMLIIDELGDVSYAINFTKENPDLWDDFLDYSMNKPRFIRGLLEEVGAASAAFNPIDVVRRIPEGLEIPGLREGIRKLIREFEIQMSISEGVAKVLRSEVLAGMDVLRAGRKKAIGFEVEFEAPEDVDLTVSDVPTVLSHDQEQALAIPAHDTEPSNTNPTKPGHCVDCDNVFRQDGKETLIGFACSHVYHLSCFLLSDPATRDRPETQSLLAQLASAADTSGNDLDGDAYAGSRSVGGKVAHAHMIKNVVQGGCRVCLDG